MLVKGLGSTFLVIITFSSLLRLVNLGHLTDSGMSEQSMISRHSAE